MFKYVIKMIAGFCFILCIVIQGKTYFALDKFKPYIFICFLISVVAIIILFTILKLKCKNTSAATNIIILILMGYAIFLFWFNWRFGGNASILETEQYAIVNHGKIVKYITYYEYQVVKLYNVLSLSANAMAVSFGFCLAKNY